MILELMDRGESVCVIDNLSTGTRSAVPKDVEFFLGDIGDQNLVRHVITDNKVDTVFHFAGSTVVPESVENPLLYYENNTANSRRLLEVCVEAGVKHFIFSSTAAVYGASEEQTIAEDSRKSPASPYGRSKLMTEWMLQDTALATDLRYVALRYFNVAGADPLGRTGQSTPKASHLIKRACQAALGKIPYLGIFGVDYETPDGTGIRDYIHVSDLVSAHALALAHLREGGESGVFNCGYGRGFSVREVIGAVEVAAGQPLEVRIFPRRAGDSPNVVADSTRIKSQLGWTPRRENLAQIVGDALAWERRLSPASP